MGNTKATAIYALQGRRSITVPTDFPLGNLIDLIVSEIELGAIFVINSKQQFLGLVRKTDLILWAHIKITGGKGRHEIPIWKFFKITDAKSAGDLVFDQSSLAIKESDSLQTALDKMLDFQEDILPVIDFEKRIVSEVSLPDLLFYVQQHRCKST